jgi:hypothetical protein
VVDGNRLNDKCWRAEMWEVELWENEWFVGTFGNVPFPAHFLSFDRSTISLLFTGATAISDNHTRQRTTSTSTTSTRPSTTHSTSPTGPDSTGISLNIDVPIPIASASGWSKTHLRPGERGPGHSCSAKAGERTAPCGGRLIALTKSIHALVRLYFMLCFLWMGRWMSVYERCAERSAGQHRIA